MNFTYKTTHANMSNGHQATNGIHDREKNDQIKPSTSRYQSLSNKTKSTNRTDMDSENKYHWGDTEQIISPAGKTKTLQPQNVLSKTGYGLSNAENYGCRKTTTEVLIGHPADQMPTADDEW